MQRHVSRGKPSSLASSARLGWRDNLRVNALDSLCQRLRDDPRVLVLYLFGSQAEGMAHDRSDVDLAVLVGKRISLAEELRLRAIAVEGLRRDDIDFVILDHATPLMRYEVVTRGRRLFARDPVAADAFELRSILTYMDTAYLRRLEHEILREATR